MVKMGVSPVVGLPFKISRHVPLNHDEMGERVSDEWSSPQFTQQQGLLESSTLPPVIIFQWKMMENCPIVKETIVLEIDPFSTEPGLWEEDLEEE